MRQDGLLGRELLDELFASVPVALAVVNSDMRFTRINGQMSELYERPCDEFTGMTVSEAIPSRAAELEPLLLRAFAGEAIRGMSFTPRTSGDARRFKASFIPVVSESDLPEVLIMLFEDVANHEVHQTLRLTHERLDLTLEGTRAGIFEWDSQANELQWSLGMGPLFGRDRGWTPDGYEEYMEVIHPDDREGLQSGVAEAAEHSVDYEREFRCLWPNGRERWLHSRVQALQDGDKTVLVGLVSDIHERKVRELGEQFLASTSFELGHSLDLTETGQRLAEQIVPAFADWCEIVVFDADADEGVQSTISLHKDPELTDVARRVQARFWADARAASPIIEKMRRGETGRRPDLTPDDYERVAIDKEHLALISRLGPTSILTVPMTARGRLVGALGLFATSPARRFGAQRTAIATELGRRAGTALDNAALMAAERHANRRLRYLQAVTDATLDNMELDDLLVELLRRVTEMIDADFGAALLYDRERDDLALRAVIGLPEESIELVRLKPGEGVAGLVLETGEPVTKEDVQGLPYRGPSAEYLRDRVRSVVAVPLFDRGEIIGVMEAGTVEEPRKFGQTETDLLELVAERAARGIANASLYTQERTNSSLLQESLLPGSLPEIDGYEMDAIYRPGQDMTDIGGDWYDAFPLPDGRFAIALGDVVGRGLNAAVLMGQLRAATRAYAREHSDPSTVIEKVDELIEELVAVPFATMVLLALDPETGRVEAASAGHLPPASSSGGLLKLTPGPALGVPVESRDSCTFTLEPGEVLVLYTDGLVERRDTPLQARLDKLAAAIASGPSRPTELLEHLESTMLSDQTHDDTAAIVVCRLKS